MQILNVTDEGEKALYAVDEDDNYVVAHHIVDLTGCYSYENGNGEAFALRVFEDHIEEAGYISGVVSKSEAEEIIRSIVGAAPLPVIGAYAFANTASINVHEIDEAEDMVLASLNGKQPIWCKLEYDPCNAGCERKGFLCNICEKSPFFTYRGRQVPMEMVMRV